MCQYHYTVNINQNLEKLSIDMGWMGYWPPLVIVTVAVVTVVIVTSVSKN